MAGRCSKAIVPPSLIATMALAKLAPTKGFAAPLCSPPAAHCGRPPRIIARHVVYSGCTVPARCPDVRDTRESLGVVDAGLGARAYQTPQPFDPKPASPGCRATCAALPLPKSQCRLHCERTQPAQCATCGLGLIQPVRKGRFAGGVACAKDRDALVGVHPHVFVLRGVVLSSR